MNMVSAHTEVYMVPVKFGDTVLTFLEYFEGN